MTSHISKLFQIALSTLAIVPVALTLNLNPVRAELTPDAIDRIQNQNLQIARNNPFQSDVEETPDDNTDTETNSARAQSFEYLKAGWEAEQAGDETEALSNYKQAVEADPSNGWSWLLVGRLIGNNPTGIKCIKKAKQLFKAEHDRQGYKLATELLQAAN